MDDNVLFIVSARCSTAVLTFVMKAALNNTVHMITFVNSTISKSTSPANYSSTVMLLSYRKSRSWKTQILKLAAHLFLWRIKFIALQLWTTWTTTVIVVHESLVCPEQLNCLLFVRKNPSGPWLYDFEIHLFTQRTTEGLMCNYRRFKCSLMLQKERPCIKSRGWKLF